jgi:NTE family protein
MGYNPPVLAFRLQLALQGGGAKIVHLVAALETVERLQTTGQIQVTRIAGSSAGAIAGSLFAAGVSASTVKNELRKFRDNLHEFPKPSKFDFFWNVIWKGNALAHTNSLKALLERLFKEQRKVYVADIPKREGKTSGPQMMIVSADIYTGKTHIAKDDEFIVTALLDSCAIPFYFRVWKHPRGGFVDGAFARIFQQEC